MLKNELMPKCLVIGGNSGIGECVADFLRCTPMSVVTPPSGTVDVCNVVDLRECVRQSGPFQYIVYSAGFNRLEWIKDISKSDVMEYTYDVNVAGFVALVSEHVRQYPDAEVSAVAVSSDAAENPMRGSLAYCVSKAALNMAIRVMARELAPRWRVNGVAPGMVEGTPMTRYIDETIPVFRGWTPEYAREYERSSVPSGRRATIEEIAETIRWVLLGPPQMTGAIVKINGGKI